MKHYREGRPIKRNAKLLRKLHAELHAALERAFDHEAAISKLLIALERHNEDAIMSALDTMDPSYQAKVAQVMERLILDYQKTHQEPKPPTA